MPQIGRHRPRDVAPGRSRPSPAATSSRKNHLGPVEAAVRNHISPGDELRTPTGRPFSVAEIDLDGVVLLSACAPITLAAAEDIPVGVREKQTVRACEEVLELVATPQDELGGIPCDAQRRDAEKTFRAVAVQPRLRERARAFLNTAGHPLSREAFERLAELVAFCELYVEVVTDPPPDSSESADV